MLPVNYKMFAIAHRLTAAARLTSCRAAGMLPLARNPAAFGSDLIPR